MKIGTAALALIATLAIAGAETVAYWRFEDGGESRVNSQGLGLELSPSVQFDGDVPAASIECDGETLPNTRSYANGSGELGSSVAASELLDRIIGTESFTIEGYLKLSDGASGEQHMRVMGNSVYQGSPGGWVISVSSGRLVFAALQGLGTNPDSPLGTLTSKASFSENAWHHFAVVGYRSSEKLVVRLFIDGIESEVESPVNFYPTAPGENAILPNADRYLISSKNSFKGLLDEIRISDVALDPSEFLKATP